MWRKAQSTSDGRVLRRGFCEFVLRPIARLTKAVLESESEKAAGMVAKLGVALKPEDWELVPKALLKKIFRRWLNVGDCVFQLVEAHLPSPVEAQPYRVPLLYPQEALDDESAKSMLHCDPDGPLVVFIAKLVPTGVGSHFYAFGRVFSGRIQAGDKVRVLSAGQVSSKAVQRAGVLMTRHFEQLTSVPAGSTVAIIGVEKGLLKQGTLASLDTTQPLKELQYSVSPVVRVALHPKDPALLPKLVEACRRLAQGDPLLRAEVSEKGAVVLAGSGELHVETCVNDLRYELVPGLAFSVSEPVVPYRESVAGVSECVCMAKSANKHNRLYVRARPIGEELTSALEKNEFAGLDAKARTQVLVEKYGWDSSEAKKVWGLEAGRSVLFVDLTKGESCVREI